MKREIIAALCLAIAAFGSTSAQSATNDQWVGIWHAHVDGQPTGTLTLAADTGELGGTVVLDMVSDRGGTPRVIASEPHVLLNPHVNGNTLSFQVKMQRPDGRIVVPTFNVTLTSPRNANIHCMTCGADAPVVALAKGQ